MEKEIIYISPENAEVIESEEYREDVTYYFSKMPEVARSLIKGAKESFSQIEKALYFAPAFIDLIKSCVPKHTLQAVLTDEQKTKIASGALKLLTKKDGSLMANLIDPKTNKIVSTIKLESVKLTPDLTQQMANFSTQMQLAKIAEEIQCVHKIIEEVRQGQEYDRLATAYSCQQKLLQAMKITNPELKKMALLRIASDAEDSRNLLMQSQSASLKYIKDQPESMIKKFIKGAAPDKIDQKMNEIRENLSAVNLVSLVEAVSFHELGETSAACQSLQYYADFIEKAYLTDGFVERLDLIDSCDSDWVGTLQDIKNEVYGLPYMKEELLLKGDN